MPDDKTSNSPEPGAEKNDLPPAGPHAKPELTDYDKTPGTGSLPDDTDAEADVGSE